VDDYSTLLAKSASALRSASKWTTLMKAIWRTSAFPQFQQQHPSLSLSLFHHHPSLSPSPSLSSIFVSPPTLQLFFLFPHR